MNGGGWFCVSKWLYFDVVAGGMSPNLTSRVGEAIDVVEEA